LVGSIYGRSSIEAAHFVGIRCQTWPPQANLVLIGWLKNLPIDASYQISVYLTKRFQMKRLFRNNQKQELPVAAMFIKRSKQILQGL
jgi:hypothetical protein